MNRHQRRAAAKASSAPTHVDDPPPVARQNEAPSSITIEPLPHQNLSIELDLGIKPQEKAVAKAGLALRIFARLLLSRFVLSRVRQPEVENLLMSVAISVDRQDVVDELIRRQASRGINL